MGTFEEISELLLIALRLGGTTWDKFLGEEKSHEQSAQRHFKHGKHKRMRKAC